MQTKKTIKPNKKHVVSKTAKVVKSTTKNRKSSIFLLIAGFVVALAIAIYYFVTTNLFSSDVLSATAGTASLALASNVSSITPTSPAIVSVTANVNKSLSFAHVELSFDKTMLQLTKEITLNNTSLNKVIKQTTMAEANSTGKITLIVGVSPTTRAQAPVGSISLASISFKAANTTTATSAITLTTATSTLVDSDALKFSLATVSPLTLSLNPSTSGGGTTSPTPTTGDTIAPVMTFTAPKDGTKVSSSKFLVNATATDASGIAKIEVYIDDKVIKTCSADTTCGFKYSGSSLTTGTHTIKAKATDKSSNANTATISIQITR